MLKKLFLAAIGLSAFAGCGDDKSPSDRVQGNWYNGYDSDTCATALSIEDDVMELKLICELPDGSLGVELHTAQVTVLSDRLEWGALKATTCADPGLRPEAPHSYRYKISDGALVLIEPDGLTAFEHLKESDDDDEQLGGTVKFGCFDEDGDFTRSEIMRL